MNSVTKKQFIENTIWKIIEQFSGRGISLIVSIVLTRLLTPDDYGLIALTTIFTNFSDILIEGGFSAALIRKKQIDENDYGCVFSVSSLVAVLLYSILFFSAPYISIFYKEPRFTKVLRVIGLILFVQAFSSTRNAFINRTMQFQLMMYCNIVAGSLSGGLGIVCAYYGLGVWALVIQRLSQQIILTLLLFIQIKWRIRWKFSWERFKEIVGFSSGVIGASLLNYFGSSIYSAVIAKGYSVSDLGYYDKGILLPEQISLNSFGAMTNVLFPTIASYQEELDRVKTIVRRTVCMTAFCIMPAMIGLMVIARNLVIVLFTEKWLLCVPIMQSFCIYYIATPFMLINVQVFLALGRSEIRVKTEFIRLIIIITGVLIGRYILRCDIVVLAYINMLISVYASLLTTNETAKLIGYTWKEKIQDVWRPMAMALVMGIVITEIDKRILSAVIEINIIQMIIKILLGIFIYLFLCIFTQNKVFMEIKMFIRNKTIK